MIGGCFDLLKTNASISPAAREIPATGYLTLIVTDQNEVALIDEDGAIHASVNVERASLKSRIAKAKRVMPPSWLGMTDAVKVYHDSQGFFTDFVASDWRHATEITYYVSPTGDDANNGLSKDTPKKTVQSLVNTLNASPPSNGATIVLAPGFYLNDLASANFGFHCNLICPDGRATFVKKLSVTWNTTPNETHTNMYMGTVTGGDARNDVVIDVTDIDAWGLPRRAEVFNAAADAAAYDTASCYTGSSSTTVLAKTTDNRVPDANLWVLGVGAHVLQTSGVNLYVENVDFWGGNVPFAINATGTSGRFIAEACSFAYSRADTANGFASNEGGRLVILDRSQAAYNTSDGFGHRRTNQVIEIDCTAYRNGFKTYLGPGTDNGTTTHDDVQSIRVNGIYVDNKDRNVHDITDTRNWLVNCVAGRARNGSVDEYESGAFVFGREGEDDATKACLTECRSVGGVVTDLASFGGSDVTYTGAPFTSTHGNGKIRRVQ